MHLNTSVVSVMTAINKKIGERSFSFPLLSRCHFWAMILYYKFDVSEQSVQLDLIYEENSLKSSAKCYA